MLTNNLIVKEQVTNSSHNKTPWIQDALLKMVELDGFEPTTPCLQSRCSPS